MTRARCCRIQRYHLVTIASIKGKPRGVKPLVTAYPDGIQCILCTPSRAHARLSLAIRFETARARLRVIKSFGVLSQRSREGSWRVFETSPKLPRRCGVPPGTGVTRARREPGPHEEAGPRARREPGLPNHLITCASRPCPANGAAPRASRARGRQARRTACHRPRTSQSHGLRDLPTVRGRTRRRDRLCRYRADRG